MRGNLAGLGNVAKNETARQALRPWVLHAVERLSGRTGEGQHARVLDIGRNAYPDKRWSSSSGTWAAP